MTAQSSSDDHGFLERLTFSKRPTWAIEKLITMLARVSPKAAAHLDELQSSKRLAWGGPMNGQAGRQELVRQILKVVDVTAVVETGTYRGTTTEFLWHLTGGPVLSAESHPRFFEYARRRFMGYDGVQLTLSDSRAFLLKIAVDKSIQMERVFFYLDAHWDADLPLHDELLLIEKYWKDPIIMIDDFEVPGDPGYCFDDYGPGRRLTMEYLPLKELSNLVVLFPTLPSAEETGARRGCAVLVDREREASLLSSVALRRP
jgi:hypothetical protein